ncbi:MAG: ABC transporter ATP-binding protein, partial [Clostridia bacterium]|nr:ABC transporter ATP-binding protein [Clostridia bacterium]
MPPRARKGTIGRLIKTIFGFYPVLLPIIIVCILFNAAVAALPPLFMQKVIEYIEDALKNSLGWSDISGKIISTVLILAAVYVVSIAVSILYNLLMAVLTQGTLKKLRRKMFDKMQTFPVKFFDTHNHGDVMSTYTNDTDTLRQLVSQSLPQLMTSGITVAALLGVMFYFSVWMAVVVILGAFVMSLVVKKIGGGSAKYFMRQQKAIGKMEGFAEEMMNGQKVIKVFCHEEESKADFDRINNELFGEAEKANKYANILGPVLNNLGNILYVIVAIWGGVLMIINVDNIGFSGLPFGISLVVPFLNITKQFTA